MAGSGLTYGFPCQQVNPDPDTKINGIKEKRQIKGRGSRNAKSQPLCK